MPTNEGQFYTELEKIFTGADIEGEGGYVNLLKIKSAYYYKKILAEFQKQVEENDIIKGFREEFFDRLYTFFEKYFSESGSVYFVKTAIGQKVYEQVYTDSKDVVLFWKTNMLYYVKSDIMYKNMDISVKDDNAVEHKFFFDCGNLKNKQNNEKKELIYVYDKKEEDKYFFNVKYKEKDTDKEKTDEQKKKEKKEQEQKEKRDLAHLSEDTINKAFTAFKKQASVDFFINKDAKKFLTEQLDMYLHQILLDEKNKFETTRLTQLKTVKEFSLNIIDFISQFEDELVRIWNKPKFVLNSNYVITMDKLTTEIIEKLKKHSGWQEQTKEWKELADLLAASHSDSDNWKEKTKEWKELDKSVGDKLPIDTKHFKDLEVEILSLFENLDEALDGRLILSENYQALNTLKNRYEEKVQCIFIDPPFNKAESDQFTYIANYKDASWISLLENRLELSKNFLKRSGGIFVNTDDKCNTYTRILLDKIFEHFQNEIIWCYEKPGAGTGKFKNNHANIWFYTKEGSYYLFNTIYVPRKGETELSKREGKFSTNYEGKISPDWWVDIWDDIPSFATAMSASERIVKMLNYSFPTQLPEKLLERILRTGSNDNDLIMDYFCGSAVSAAVAQKIKRKWITVELDKDNFWKMDLPRLKLVILGYQAGISKDLEEKYNGSGFFKYYELEQYEQTLDKMKYSEIASTIFDETNPFANYVFLTDSKLSNVLEIKDGKVDLDFDKLYKNIDFPETISLVKGKAIKKITADTVVLEGNETIRYDYKNFTDDEKVDFVKMLKPLLWWGRDT